jgi:hypothetical protein
MAAYLVLGVLSDIYDVLDRYRDPNKDTGDNLASISIVELNPEI